MSTVVATLVSSIKSRMATVLGSEYREISYANEVEKNTFRGGDQRYGVLPGSFEQIAGVTRAATYDQTFELILTKGYGRSNVSDSAQQQAATDLFEQLHAINADLVNTKAGSPANVMNVFNLNAESPEYLTDEKIVVLRASIVITYRVTLN